MLSQVDEYLTHISLCQSFDWLLIFADPLYRQFTQVGSERGTVKCIIWYVAIDDCRGRDMDIEKGPNRNVFKILTGWTVSCYIIWCNITNRIAVKIDLTYTTNKPTTVNGKRREHHHFVIAAGEGESQVEGIIIGIACSIGISLNKVLIGIKHDDIDNWLISFDPGFGVFWNQKETGE